MARDKRLYRVTYNNGKTKIGFMTMLAPVLGAMRHNWGYKKPVKIERAPEPVWEDVTEEFLTGD